MAGKAYFQKEQSREEDANESWCKYALVSDQPQHSTCRGGASQSKSVHLFSICVKEETCNILQIGQPFHHLSL